MPKICDICGREMRLDGDDLQGNPVYNCPATPDEHKIAVLECELAKAKAHAEVDDAAVKAIRDREEGLLSQLRESQERELALREALDALIKKSYHSRKCDQAYGDPLCECGHEDACVLAWDALDNTSATAQQTVERIEREALEKQDQTGWLVERNMAAEGQEYLFVDPVGLLAWTTDNLKALRLSRKSDAESLVAIAEDAVRVAEHAWIRRAAILGEKDDSHP